MGVNAILEKIVAGKWIAGATIDDAIDATRKLNKQGIRGIINCLGEEYGRLDYVDRAVSRYMNLINLIKRAKVGADIAVKLTELGLIIDKGLAERNYAKIVAFAKKNGVFIWIDMEEEKFVSDSLGIYRRFIKSGNTGVCIQSYLRRSMNDLESLPKGATIRLVKGAYSNSREVAFQTRKETTDNYYELMEYTFKNFWRFTIATHDSDIIERARRLNKKYRRDVTYAMLKGIRTKLALELRQKGLKVSVYVPFGEEWVRYSYRRFKELSTAVLVVRSFIGR